MVRWVQSNPRASLVGMARQWIGAILLIGGIIVAAAVAPVIGVVVAAIGAGVLFLTDRGDDQL
jgi:hypothetical protein